MFCQYYDYKGLQSGVLNVTPFQFAFVTKPPLKTKNPAIRIFLTKLQICKMIADEPQWFVIDKVNTDMLDLILPPRSFWINLHETD